MKNISDGERAKVLKALEEAESQLATASKEIKTLEARFKELEAQRSIAERQVWLAKLVLQSTEGVNAIPTSASLRPSNAVQNYSEMSIPDGAEDILRKRGRMLTSRELAEALVEGGRIFKNMTNATASVTTSLKRHPGRFFCKSVGGINRFGLTESESDGQN